MCELSSTHAYHRNSMQSSRRVIAGVAKVRDIGVLLPVIAEAACLGNSSSLETVGMC